jgi:hypothetical protein
VVLPAATDPDAVDDEPDAAGLLDELLLQALATASVSTATAAVPYRHRLPVLLFVGLTCSCLLTSKVLR